MSVNQYGPALFPSVKQVRHTLFERGLLQVHTRADVAPGDWATEPDEDRRAAADRSE